MFGNEQRRAYNRSDGGLLPEELDAQKCECNDNNKTQEQLALVTAAKAVQDGQVTVGDRIWSGLGAVAAGVGTVIAGVIPFDGPVGEIGMGALTAGLAARVFASSALTASARQVLARQTAASWARIFQPAM